MKHDDSFFRIQAPCPLASSALRGDGPTRYCDQCDREVHDLSALTRRQAVRLRQRFQRRGERLCGLIRHNPDGTVHFRPSLRERLRQHWRAMPALAVLFSPGGCPSEEAPPPPPAPQVAKETPIEAEAANEIDEETLRMLNELGGYID